MSPNLPNYTCTSQLVHIKNTQKESQYKHTRREAFCVKMHQNGSQTVTISKSSKGECPQISLACCVPAVHAYTFSLPRRHFAKSQLAPPSHIFCMQP